jgi:hypothetical protein
MHSFGYAPPLQGDACRLALHNTIRASGRHLRQHRYPGHPPVACPLLAREGPESVPKWPPPATGLPTFSCALRQERYAPMHRPVSIGSTGGPGAGSTAGLTKKPIAFDEIEPSGFRRFAVTPCPDTTGRLLLPTALPLFTVAAAAACEEERVLIGMFTSANASFQHTARQRVTQSPRWLPRAQQGYQHDGRRLRLPNVNDAQPYCTLLGRHLRTNAFLNSSTYSCTHTHTQL